MTGIKTINQPPSNVLRNDEIEPYCNHHPIILKISNSNVVNRNMNTVNFQKCPDVEHVFRKRSDQINIVAPNHNHRSVPNSDSGSGSISQGLIPNSLFIFIKPNRITSDKKFIISRIYVFKVIIISNFFHISFHFTIIFFIASHIL